MRYHVLATDYDGTVAHDGHVDDSTVDALKRFLATGRRLIMVTGRELPELKEVFPHLELFEWVVAENGGLLYRPSTNEETQIADSPPSAFVQALRDKNVGPISVGRSIVATWEPHQVAVLETIREMGLELQVIFNKDAVMVLPAGVNKATGLADALRRMEMSIHNVIGVGDAENDHAFLKQCELSVAVANALPAVKETADFVARFDHGAGVTELINRVIDNDLADLIRRVPRHSLPLGTYKDQQIDLPPYGRGILICGPSASGKSTVATRIVESLQDQDYQFCLFDPEGDYEGLEGAVIFGGPDSAPPEDEIIRFLQDPQANAVVCMTGMPIGERPNYFLKLLSPLLHMRSQTGRPHWLILDEAHHLMPSEWSPTDGTLPRELLNCLLITVHPDLLATTILKQIDTALILGAGATETLKAVSKRVEQPLPDNEIAELQSGEVALWMRERNQLLSPLQIIPCRSVRHRHSRKYALGELPPDRSFYFHGPDGKLNLRAQNLMLFLQIADGLDDVTWDFHLRRGDYSKWFRECIKDENLASKAERIEGLENSPKDSRKLIRSAIEEIYTLPATPSVPVAGAG